MSVFKNIKRNIRKLYKKDQRKGKSTLDVISSFPLFEAHGEGKYKQVADLTILSINQTIPNLALLAKSISTRNIELQPIASFADNEVKVAQAEKLKLLLDKYGSDKARHHYHFLYGPILGNGTASEILEIGLGTNYPDIVSNMGKRGKPGASLRAFRDFTDANIYGADVDKRVLFKEHRIETFYVDQTDISSFEELGAHLPSNLDLVIDDGLHSPNANIATLIFGMSKIREGGWVVIEDIGYAALPLWEIISIIMPPNFKSHLFISHAAIVFAVQKNSK